MEYIETLFCTVKPRMVDDKYMRFHRLCLDTYNCNYKSMVSLDEIKLSDADLDQLIDTYSEHTKMAQIQTNLGMLYFIKKNYNKAKYYFELAACQEFAPALCLLGLLYYRGWGVPQDYPTAFAFFELSLKQGYGIAQYNLGLMYEHGHGISINYFLAFQYYLPLAQQGYKPAQYRLATLYVHGNGVKKNFDEALKWLELAANAGHSPSQIMIVDILCFKENFNAQCIKWMKYLAENGDINSMSKLGYIYEHGCGVYKNKNMAVKYYTAAAEYGCASSQLRLWSHYYSIGNYTQAIKWGNMAARQGKTEHLLELVTLYQNGTSPDYDSAFYWLKVIRHNQDAKCILATYFERGLGTERNYLEAYKLYSELAECGNEFAKNKIVLFNNLKADISLKLHGYIMNKISEPITYIFFTKFIEYLTLNIDTNKHITIYSWNDPLLRSWITDFIVDYMELINYVPILDRNTVDKWFDDLFLSDSE